MLKGGPISKRSSVFSGDGRLLVSACGQSIRVYSAATGEQCSQFDGHTGEVTCLVLNPEEPMQVYSGSLDGSIRLWDLVTGQCLKTFAVREAIRYMAIHKTLRQAYLSIDWRDGQSGRVISYNLDKQKAGTSAMRTRAAGPLAMNPEGSLVATVDKHSLFVWRVGPEISQPINLHHTKSYTCVALSQDETVLAAGDVSGRIQVWRNIGSAIPPSTRPGGSSGAASSAAATAPGSGAAAIPSPTTTHWHSGPVASLSISNDSTYLRSGGREGVLVSWTLDGMKPNFLPRLGGALLGIEHCPSDPSKLLIRQADNVLRLINLATNTISQSVFGLKPAIPPPVGPAGLVTPAAGPAVVPGSGLLAVPTNNAVLQLFDSEHDRHVSLLQVVPRSDVTATFLDAHNSGATSSRRTPPAVVDTEHLLNPAASVNPYLAHVTFTADGSCLATVDVRPGAGPLGSTETSLKFWDVQQGGRKVGAEPYQLNTLADDPHKGPITCIAAHPSQDVIVTAGGGLPVTTAAGSAYSQDQIALAGQPEFKVWERVAVPRRPGSKVERPTCWRCRSVGSYKGHAFSSAAFSGDGSILALAAGTKVTLWDAASSALVAVLPACPDVAAMMAGVANPKPLRDLAFIAGAPYLVGSTGSQVVVWDLLTCSIAWSAPVSNTSLAADPVYPRFAVATAMSVTQASSKPAENKDDIAREAAAAADGNADASTPAANNQSGGTAKATSTTPQKKSDADQGKQGDVDGAAPMEVDASTPQGAQQKPSQQSQPQASQPQQQQQQRRIPASCVLVFEPTSPVPVCSSRMDNVRSVRLVFNGSSSTATSQGRQCLSRLLALTDDRQYAELQWTTHRKPQKQGKSKKGAEGSTQQGEPSTDGPASAFDAVFGALFADPGKNPESGRMDADGDVDMAPVASSTDAALKRLFDAPSHVLPPPSTLASAFMRLLTQQQ